MRNIKDFITETASEKVMTKLGNIERMKTVQIPTPEERRKKLLARRETESKEKEVTPEKVNEAVIDKGSNLSKDEWKTKITEKHPKVEFQDKNEYGHNTVTAHVPFNNGKMRVGYWSNSPHRITKTGYHHEIMNATFEETEMEDNIQEAVINPADAHRILSQHGGIGKNYYELSSSDMLGRYEKAKELGYKPQSQVRSQAHQTTLHLEKQAKKYVKESLEEYNNHEFVMQSLADKDINSKIVGKKSIVVHKDNVAKAKAHLKKIGFHNDYVVTHDPTMNEDNSSFMSDVLCIKDIINNKDKHQLLSKLESMRKKEGSEYSTKVLQTARNNVKEEVELIDEAVPSYTEYVDKVANFKKNGYTVVDSKHSMSKSHIRVKTPDGDEKTYHYTSTGTKVETH